MFNRYPYTNFHELNLDYFIQHFNEIFTEWEQLYNELQSWKTDTTEELDQWRADVEKDLDDREAALRTELEIWKQETAEDFSGWETATLNALDAWKTAATAQFEAIRVQAAASADAAAAAQTAAETARTQAQAAQAAAEAAAASVQASAAQITTNTEDIADLKTQLDETTVVIKSGFITYSDFVSGKRVAPTPQNITADPKRVTTANVYMLEKGDIIGVVGTYNGIKYAIGGKYNSSAYDSGWQADNFSYTVENNGIYYVNVAKTNSDETIDPSDVTFSVIITPNTIAKQALDLANENAQYLNNYISLDSFNNMNWVIGTLKPDGTLSTQNNRIRSAYIKITNQKTVKTTGNADCMCVHTYDDSKTHLGYTPWLTEYSIPSNAKYIRVVIRKDTNDSDILDSEIQSQGKRCYFSVLIPNSIFTENNKKNIDTTYINGLDFVIATGLYTTSTNFKTHYFAVESGKTYAIIGKCASRILNMRLAYTENVPSANAEGMLIDEWHLGTGEQKLLTYKPIQNGYLTISYYDIFIHSGSAIPSDLESLIVSEWIDGVDLAFAESIAKNSTDIWTLYDAEPYVDNITYDLMNVTAYNATYYNGGIDGWGTIETRILNTKTITCPCDIKIKAKDDYQITGWSFTNPTVITGNGAYATNWTTGAWVTEFVAKKGYNLVLVIRNSSENLNISPSEWEDAFEVENATLDIEAIRDALFTKPLDNSPKGVFGIMTYNVGGWYIGSGTNVPVDKYNKFITLQKNILDRYMPDVLCLQEYMDNFAPGKPTVDVLLGERFRNIVTGKGNTTYHGKAICTSQTMVDAENINFTGEDRNYEKAYIYCNGKKVCFISTHLSLTSSQIINECTELLSAISGEEYVVIAMDSNVDAHDPDTTLYDASLKQFTDAGYNVANNGNYITYGPTDKALDTFVTTSNIEIKSLVVDEQKDGLSEGEDHFPFIMYAEIY